MTKCVTFADWEVRAVLAGTKIQFRRPIQPQPPDDVKTCGPRDFLCLVDWRQNVPIRDPIPCPYVPGDHLIVREAYCLQSNVDDEQPPFDDGRPILRRFDEDSGDNWTQPHYKSTDPQPELDCDHDKCQGDACTHPWRSPATMPAWASRISLEVVRVWPQRVRDISEADAWFEGLSMMDYHRRIDGFRGLWDSTYGKRGFPWDTSWCWAVEFRRVKP